MRLTLPIALATLMVGCTLARAPILPRDDGGMGGIDGGDPAIDAPLPPGPDVPVMEIDAPTGCSVSCEIGQRCEGTTCVCDPNLCAGNRTCQAGECVTCGGAGERCCPDSPCRDGRACGGDGLCPTSRCSTIGAPCCAEGVCEGLTCRGGACIALCGGDGQACCPSGPQCDMGFSCRLAWDLTNRCQSCGGLAEPCCAGACDSGLRCTTVDICSF